MTNLEQINDKKKKLNFNFKLALPLLKCPTILWFLIRFNIIQL